MRKRFSRLRDGLAKTRRAITEGIRGALGRGAGLDRAALDSIEETLIAADLGVETALHLIDGLRERFGASGAATEGGVREFLALEIEKALRAAERQGAQGEPGAPLVVMVAGVNGVVRELQVSPVPENGLLPDDMIWQVGSGCPEIRKFDAITAMGNGQIFASLDPEGTPDGTYASVLAVDDLVLGNRTAVVPFDLERVSGMTLGSAKTGSLYSAQAYLLSYLLAWFDSEYVSSVTRLPGLGQATVTAHPNPFNPSTTIAFDLPRAMEVSLDIYDLQGRLVRRLLDESPYLAGNHKQVWDGRDTGGQATASGMYFYRFEAGDQKQVGKLTLLK